MPAWFCQYPVVPELNSRLKRVTIKRKTVRVTMVVLPPASMRNLAQSLKLRSPAIAQYINMVGVEYIDRYLLYSPENLIAVGYTDDLLAHDEELNTCRLKEFLMLFGDLSCPVATLIIPDRPLEELVLADVLAEQGKVHFALYALLQKLALVKSLDPGAALLLILVKFALLYARHPELEIPPELRVCP